MERRSALLLSCYELGRQPLGLALPLAYLSNAGLEARGIDLAVEPLDEEAVRSADFIGISVPMHTALRIALDLLPRLRALNPRAHLSLYGLYATLNAELLLSSGASSVLSGELEEELVSLARGVAPVAKGPILKRLLFPRPARSELPPLDRYARLELEDGSSRMVGAVETTRGCLHLCRHCPIPPIYGGRFFVIPRETVLGDVRQLVEAGANHIDFADPDFLNGPSHALAIARALHREFPRLSFNFTAKVEHLVKHRGALAELSELGCLFVVSAVESLSDRVLRELDKGHDRNAVFEVHQALREVGIALRPTFVPFTPWTTREDYGDLFHWIARAGLVEHVDAVQLTLRLLIPPGSLLLENESLSPFLAELDPRALTYRWTHPDSEMDRLQESAATLVEEGVARGRSNHSMFHDLARIAFHGPDEPNEPNEADEFEEVASPARPPRLTEAWFC
jgi:radical SAM superfamily enzyme YgiQ (UPF0313 family)